MLETDSPKRSSLLAAGPPDGLAPTTTSRGRAVTAAIFGTVVEWYDFSIYGAASALVFGHVFFPNSSPLIGLLASYAAFAVGFLIRPIGGVFFSYFGDKYGRKPVLIATLVTMGGATTAIGLIPSYASIGIGAPLLLVLLRMIQGFGAGGEFGGAILFASEYAPPGRRGLFGSFAPAAVMLSLLVSALIFSAFTRLPHDAFFSWGWRVPFLLSLVAVFTGLFIRRNVEETPEYRDAAQHNTTQTRMPVIEVLRDRPGTVLAAAGVNIIQVMGYVHVVFATSYMAIHLHMPRSTALGVQMLTYVAAGAACIFGGALSDRIGRRPVMISACIASAAFAFPMFMLLDTRVPIWMCVAMVVGSFALFPFFGAQSAFYTELFETRHRYSGITVARESTYALFGGPLPFIATALTERAGGASWPVSMIMVVMSLISLATLLLMPRLLPAKAAENTPLFPLEPEKSR
jgi:MHS family shikimate/dehydroshikimate transporter-like MFS transporter